VTTSSFASQKRGSSRKHWGSERGLLGGFTTLAAFVALAVGLASGTPRVQAEETATSASITVAPVFPAAPPLPAPTHSALDLRNPTPEEPKPSLFRAWWFWTAVGTAAAATIIVIVASSRGHAPPTTDLGNQEFQP
jgi:hypothetical protein